MLHSRNGSVGMATRLLVRKLRNCLSIPGTDNRFFCASNRPDWLWAPASQLPNGCRGSVLQSANSLEIWRQENEVDQSVPPSTEVKNACRCASTPPIYDHGVVLNKAWRKIYLSLLFFFCFALDLFQYQRFNGSGG
jgi:hypothetical protein